VLFLRRTVDTERVVAALKAEFDASLFEVKTWVELNDFYANTAALYERQFGLLQLIILVLVLLSVAKAVNMSAFERVGKFGTMMALGNRRGHLFRLLVVENALLGVAAGTIGVSLGIVLAYSISVIGIPMPPPNANIGFVAHIRIVPSVILAAFLVGACAAVMAALWPAWRVSHLPVHEALRQNY
jgi:putative ABC transport system permease protein